MYSQCEGLILLGLTFSKCIKLQRQQKIEQANLCVGTWNHKYTVKRVQFNLAMIFPRSNEC